MPAPQNWWNFGRTTLAVLEAALVKAPNDPALLDQLADTESGLGNASAAAGYRSKAAALRREPALLVPGAGATTLALGSTGQHSPRERMFTIYFCFCILTLAHFGHFHLRCLW